LDKAENKEKSATREYRTDDLIVYWDAKKCIHATLCWKTSPEVFKPQERPWIHLEAAAPEKIMKTIDLCPSGALKYKLIEGSKVDPAFSQGPVKIKMTPQGPLKVEGPAQIFDPDGQLIKEADQMLLCTCGKSGNRPFCDGSHMHKE